MELQAAWERDEGDFYVVFVCKEMENGEEEGIEELVFMSDVSVRFLVSFLCVEMHSIYRWKWMKNGAETDWKDIQKEREYGWGDEREEREWFGC